MRNVAVAALMIGTLAAGALHAAGTSPTDRPDEPWSSSTPRTAQCNPSKTDQEDARALANIAKKSNPQDALGYYRGAYARDCRRHELLKAIAEIYVSEKQYAAALETYQLYMARAKPTGAELTSIQSIISQLEWKIMLAEPMPGSSASAVAKAAPPQAARAVAPTPTYSQATAQPIATTDKPSYVPIWAVLGTGAALIVTGTTFTVIGANDLSSVESKREQLSDRPECRATGCPELDTRYQTDRNQAAGMRTAGLIVLGVGGALAVGSLVTYWLLRSSERPVTITSGPTGIGLGLLAKF